MAKHRGKNFVADNEFRKERKLIFPILKEIRRNNKNELCLLPLCPREGAAVEARE